MPRMQCFAAPPGSERRTCLVDPLWFTQTYSCGGVHAKDAEFRCTTQLEVVNSHEGPSGSVTQVDSDEGVDAKDAASHRATQLIVVDVPFGPYGGGGTQVDSDEGVEARIAESSCTTRGEHARWTCRESHDRGLYAAKYPRSFSQSQRHKYITREKPEQLPPY